MLSSANRLKVEEGVREGTIGGLGNQKVFRGQWAFYTPTRAGSSAQVAYSVGGQRRGSVVRSLKANCWTPSSLDA